MSKTESRQMDLAQASAIEQVEDLAQRYSMGALASVGRVQRAIMLARGIEELGKAIDPLMTTIMPLMNRRLGFLTDRDPRRGGKDVYPAAVVKECVLEALLRGINVAGNEFNIIAGSCYVTKEGLSRLVAELPGLTDLNLSFGVPSMKDGGAVVRVNATWKLNGQAQQLTDEEGKPGRNFAVRLNAGMGVDGALGKAERKALAAIYRRVTGSTLSEGDVTDPPEALPGPTRTSQVLERLNGPAAAGQPADPGPNTATAAH